MKSHTIASLVCGLLLAGAAVLPASAASSYSSGGTTSTTTSGTTPKASTMTTASTTQHKSHARTYFYVSLKGREHACEIVTHRPSHHMMVGSHAYRSYAAAAHAMAAAKICRA